MMGCGKTTIGRKLADKLGYVFMDTDDIIERQENLKISDIFRIRGEEDFRMLESSVLRSIQADHAVIATGGGLPCHSDNASYMHATGFVIFLDTPVDILVKRLQKSTDRPLVAGKSRKDIKVTLESLLHGRRTFYEIAHIILLPVRSLNNTVHQIVEAIAHH